MHKVDMNNNAINFNVSYATLSFFLFLMNY